MTSDQIQQWAREAGMAGMLTDVVTNFAELQQFAHLSRADLEAENETLRYEVDAIAGIKQERDSLKAEVESLRVQVRKEQMHVQELQAELGQYPDIQSMLMSENKQLRADAEKWEMEWCVLVDEFGLRKAADEVEKLQTKVAERSAKHLAAHITYDKGYTEGRLDAIEMCAKEAEETYDIFLREKPFLATPIDVAVAIRRLK